MRKQVLSLVECQGISALLSDRVAAETRNNSLIEELKELYKQKEATERELRLKIKNIEEEILRKFGSIADNNAIIEANMEATRRLLPIGSNIDIKS